MDVKQRAAIVTGAGKGMGAAVAKTLRNKGYQLVLLSNSGGAEQLAAELNCLGITGSVTSETDIEAAVELCMSHYGRVDGVVNSTGHPPKGPLLNLTDEDWHTGMDMVFMNVVKMARAVTPLMIKGGGGSIVNISTFATYEPDSSFPVSACMRAALGSYTKLYATEYASDGIRMNNILPGFIDSYPVDESILKRIPTGRYGKVSEIGATALFLLSDGSEYITGQNIRVDGGITKSV
jgi:NAD(P)-dependent dehydrogenase (short-subunit alcohol dehydrogenase family)|tara:strand:+ start:421 stop:1128 length:708 start_codon:yes stop_codon:yes gene_type:complete